jgi:hypothetical protein
MDSGEVVLMPRHHSFTLSEKASDIVNGVPDGRTVAKWKYTMATKHFGKVMKHPDWKYPTVSKSQFVSKAIVFYSEQMIQAVKMDHLESELDEANARIEALEGSWWKRFTGAFREALEERFTGAFRNQ